MSIADDDRDAPEMTDEEEYFEAEQSVEECIRRNPLVAVMGAFILGLVLGRLKLL